MNAHSRVALNTVRLTEIRLVHTVYFRELDLLVLESSGCFLVVRSKGFAVTAPTRQYEGNGLVKTHVELHTMVQRIPPKSEVRD